MRRWRLIVPALVCAGLFLSAGTAVATPPDHFVAASNEEFTFMVYCGTFEASVTGVFSDRFTVFFDQERNLTRFTEVVSAPHDV